MLDLETGLVSPQFHVKLDFNFQTLREKGASIPASTWQVKCRFVQQPTKVAQWDPARAAGPSGKTLPMQQPEGAQAAQPSAPADNKSGPDPPIGDNQDADPEPQELPPL